ncbi:hypothetical protein [Apibacter sp. HY039]|uniref:hypothetical protein n=1 Tax=Apibacter sp. HY039 TaxID=2501476 RepID=UPI000FEBA325|nr:hypothetical protein [Apibacter sp. HY039]
MYKENEIIKVKAYNYKIIQKYILLSMPFFILGIYLITQINAKFLFVGCVILFGCIYSTVLYKIKKSITEIIFEENDINIENCKINISEILNYNLFKFSLQNFCVLRIKTKKISQQFFFIDIKEKDIINDYFSNSTISLVRKGEFINILPIVVIFIFMIITSLIVSYL